MNRFCLYIVLCAMAILFTTMPHISKAENLASGDAQIDSMVLLLSSTSEPIERFDILVNLSDLASGKKDLSFSRKLWKESSQYLHSENQKEKEAAQKAAAAGMIKLIVYNLDNKTDSFNYYMDLARQNLEKTDAQRITTYYQMIKDVRTLQSLDFEECHSILKKNIQRVERFSFANEFEEMSQLYIIASGLTMLSASKHLINNYATDDIHLEDRVVYIKRMLDISEKIPIEKDFLFRQQALMFLSAINDSFMVEYSIKLLNEYERTLKLPDYAKRPFYSQRTRIRCAGVLMQSLRLSIEESDEYFRQFNELLDKYPAQAPTPPTEYYRALQSRAYYFRRENYEAIVACCDTLLRYNTYPLFITEFLYDKATSLSKLGRYEEAFDNLSRMVILKDSISTADTGERYLELQNLYEVNSMKMEKMKLYQRYQAIGAIIGFFILLGALVWGISHKRMSDKTNRLYKELAIQTEKAKESDNMKGEFINSMCHEFRTPMNIITGFSSLIASDDLEKKDRQHFQKEIEIQSEFLLDMMEDLLQVSDLNHTIDEKKLIPTDINSIFERCIKRACAIPKNDISYKIEIGESCLDEHHQCIIKTNSNYISAIVKNLLSNAKKFSQTGEIILSYKFNEERTMIEVAITDQGCGIPIDKQKWVFERFNKIDVYVQGAGLGLYTCQLMVDQLKGKIWIDPEYTGGTKVIFQIPTV